MMSLIGSVSYRDFRLLFQALLPLRRPERGALTIPGLIWLPQMLKTSKTSEFTYSSVCWTTFHHCEKTPEKISLKEKDLFCPIVSEVLVHGCLVPLLWAWVTVENPGGRVVKQNYSPHVGNKQRERGRKRGGGGGTGDKI